MFTAPATPMPALSLRDQDSECHPPGVFKGRARQPANISDPLLKPTRWGHTGTPGRSYLGERSGADPSREVWEPTSWVLLLIKPSRCLKNLQRRKRVFQPTILYGRTLSPETYLPYSKKPSTLAACEDLFHMLFVQQIPKGCDKSQACPFSEMIQETGKKENGSLQQPRTGDPGGVHGNMSCWNEHSVRPGGPGVVFATHMTFVNDSESSSGTA